MRVTADEVWFTPSTMHVRVIVHATDNRWRHKYYVAVPIADIPDEALQPLLDRRLDDTREEDHQQTALF